MKLRAEQDLLDLINNRVEENLSLDYKASPSLGKASGKKKEISKDVSAMANSNGGYIIYGISEYDEKEKSHLPKELSPINRLEFSKEWLEQVINSNIFPRISGIKIYSIQLSSSPDEVAYVSEIPKSDTAHQAGDMRYYKRFNFESVAMYDYEVRDIMNRATFPKIDIEFVIQKFTYEDYHPMKPFEINTVGGLSVEKEFITDYTLYIYARNNGNHFANFVNAFIKIPSSIIEKETLKFYQEDKDGFIEIGIDNTVRDVVDIKNAGFYNINKYGPSRFDPILPELKGELKKLKLNESVLEYEDIIYWSVYADNSDKRSGETEINSIELKIKKQ